MRKIVIASDSYKGCLSSSEVACAMSKGIAEVYPDCQIVKLAVADGGEGTVEALVDTLGGHMEWAEVSDPLGRPVKAAYGVAGDLTIIESAAACGLTLLKREERNPLLTSTKGLSELILAAIEKGCKRFLIGLGGSATNDGGMGMISAEGFLEKARGLEFTVACDVDTPYIGENGASRVFGPQKGASPEDVEILEDRLRGYASKIMEDTGIDVSDMPGAGAAGGLAGLLATRKWKNTGECLNYGLEKMSPIAVLLVGTGTIAGVIKASAVKDLLIGLIAGWEGGAVLLAPISSILMCAASASTTAGATIASASFAQTVLAAGVNAVWAAAMTNAGATVIDHLPHGSFFHATGGSIGMDLKERLKLIPYESLVGLVLVTTSVIMTLLLA